MHEEFYNPTTTKILHFRENPTAMKLLEKQTRESSGICTVNCTVNCTDKDIFF